MVSQQTQGLLTVRQTVAEFLVFRFFPPEISESRQIVFRGFGKCLDFFLFMVRAIADSCTLFSGKNQYPDCNGRKFLSAVSVVPFRTIKLPALPVCSVNLQIQVASRNLRPYIRVWFTSRTLHRTGGYNDRR